MEIINFVVSERWVSNFMRPNNLSMHKTTNLTSLTDNELVYLYFVASETPKHGTDKEKNCGWKCKTLDHKIGWTLKDLYSQRAPH
ncbi:hypothetical protein PsorP6_000695 [Peronosclerospora sorghi]|uniref:Uncharacterized protein n=1 Tax=Peronosclerospora sorghi TaxID=230839 RepID=A0ACC0WT52_9STRA|nr:hypothetical protein PsorP6_000695 [Peronosclerospora sorghi]